MSTPGHHTEESALREAVRGIFGRPDPEPEAPTPTPSDGAPVVPSAGVRPQQPPTSPDANLRAAARFLFTGDQF